MGKWLKLFRALLFLVRMTSGKMKLGRYSKSTLREKAFWVQAEPHSELADLA